MMSLPTTAYQETFQYDCTNIERSCHSSGGQTELGCDEKHEDQASRVSQQSEVQERLGSVRPPEWVWRAAHAKA